MRIGIGVYFKLSTTHLKLSPNFHLSFCATILTLKLWNSDLLIPPGPWAQCSQQVEHLLSRL